MSQASTDPILIFGEFLEEVPPSNEYLTLHFSLTSTARKRRWSNYGLSADFLGDYFAAFFPGDEVTDSSINRRDTVKGAVSYIANELLENAVKYSDEAADQPVSITLYLYEQEIIFKIINPAQTTISQTYQNFIQELQNADLDELYTLQLEKTASGTGESHLGLLTMMNDYSARFGWKFEPIPDHRNLTQITVMVRLEV